MAPKSSLKSSDIPDSVPMFLRKTYHMIDSCDPTVASWSEDGETFVVKDPTKFESEIIPQFFKHSKFTSFVRQLNFYSFRKIKYVDTIRLDPKLEAETANFWRFRHEKFQRGKPQLLTEIKRMTASQTRAAAEKAAKAEAVAAASSLASGASNSAMKEEIDTLKARLEEMNRNMSELTSMVQKVSLNEPTTDNVQPGNKRKKVEFVTPEPVTSINELPEASLDLLLDEDQLSLFPNTPSEMDAMDAALSVPIPSPTPSARVSSSASNMTDSDFVDQLFDAFGENDGDDMALPEPAVVTSGPSYPMDNRPDPRLMDRLSEALAVLPKGMQEQIVNRLIANITSNSLVGNGDQSTVSSMPKHDDDDMEHVVLAQQTPDEEVIGMPLAAATLASLLSYYSNLVKDKQDRDASKPTVKPIPVVPCLA